MTARRPTSEDIKAGLAQFENHDSQHNRYQQRIAAHLQSIIERERTQGEALRVLEAEICAACGLPQGDMTEMGLGIRAGEISLNDTLLTGLKKVALARVAIDNPRYATYLYCTQPSPEQSHD